MCEDLLYMLDSYMDDKLRHYRDNSGQYDLDIEDEYDENLHRVRTIALTLWNIEAIPSPRTNKQLKYAELSPQRDEYGTSENSVAQTIDYRTTMMYYLDARRNLTEQVIKDKVNNPFHALHMFLDVGFALLSPYVTVSDYNRWQDSCGNIKEKFRSDKDVRDVINKSKTDKIMIQSHIMDREGFQMQHRDVDVMGYDSEGEEILDKFSEMR